MKLLNNTGSLHDQNICFLNASLQAVKSLGSCREFFINRDYDPGELHFPICDEIGRLFKGNSEAIQSAGQLRTLIGHKEGCSSYNDGTQQDAGGLLLILIDLICEEIKTITGTDSSFMKKFTSEQKISYKFTETDDGSCSLCGNPSQAMDQNVILFPLRTPTKHGKRRTIKDLINENFNTVLETR